MSKTKSILLLALILALTAALPLLSQWANGKIIFETLSVAVNKQIVYQSVTLLMTLLFLFALSLFRKAEFRTYFRKGNISAPIIPEPIVGIKPKSTENWYHFGRNFAVIISVVTAVVIYFQLVKRNHIPADALLKVLPFSILFAIVNGFVEESITRLGVVVAFKDVISDKSIPLVSGLIFGVVHYFGNPGGIIGVIVAGFFGWLLAKSILETKGVFWAWLIHFLQDVIIFSALLNIL